MSMYSGKMFFSTQSDVGAGRFGGFFSHSIDAVMDAGAISTAAAALQRKHAGASSPPSNSTEEASLEHVFVRWHNWRGMKNWSICGNWGETKSAIHDLRGMMIPQLAFLNKHVRTRAAVHAAHCLL